MKEEVDPIGDNRDDEKYGSIFDYIRDLLKRVADMDV